MNAYYVGASIFPPLEFSLNWDGIIIIFTRVATHGNDNRDTNTDTNTETDTNTKNIQIQEEESWFETEWMHIMWVNLFSPHLSSLSIGIIIIFTRVATNGNDDGDTNADIKKIQIQILKFSLNRDGIIIIFTRVATNGNDDGDTNTDTKMIQMQILKFPLNQDNYLYKRGNKR